MRLVVSRRATRRLGEISDYTHERNPTAALRVQKSIRDAFALLLIYLEAGRAIDHGVRRFVVPRVPYKIDQSAGAILIITVRHAAQGQPR